MCGLVGFWQYNNSLPEMANVIQAMADQLITRGPDASGYWLDKKIGLALGHRRLTVMDLTAAGNQPMISQSGSHIIIYNGEVYNARQIQLKLLNSGVKFKGHSDTEIILEACAHWGIEQTVKQLIGMFAFVIWNRKRQKLTLVRDRLGIKPLYWGLHNNVLFFGSQLKSFSPHPNWQPTIDPAMVNKFLTFNYLVAPYSIYKDIYKLQPGHLLTIDQHQNIHNQCYWHLDEYLEKGYVPLDLSVNLAIEQLDVLLTTAVERCLVSDVPVGAFLSGGIDSSTVVALMQKLSKNKVKTFAIGFENQQYNEAIYAKQVAKHLDTDHYELYLSEQQAQAIIPELASFYDEPFADMSQIPTFLVSKLAKQQVTVSLSGDGGDELFAGYNRYLFAAKFWRYLQWLPKPLRQLIAAMIKILPPRGWDAINFTGLTNVGDKAYKFANLLKVNNQYDYYKSLITLWHDLEYEQLWPDKLLASNKNFIEQMQYLDLHTYLPGDILCKVDRASMAVSLEARVPLLDHTVVEFAWSLPFKYKINNGQSKWLLRQVLNKYLPEKLIHRPKMGFGIPIGDWLTTNLQTWADDLLSTTSLLQSGFLDVKAIQARWQEHKSGKRDWQYSLWGILMFQAWYQQYG